MIIARLNERIEIERSTIFVDENKNHLKTWVRWFSCAACVDTYQGNEKSGADAVRKKEVITFTVRYCSETAVVTSTDYRVKFRGCTYNIRSVDPMNYRRECIKLKCERVRNDGRQNSN